MGRIGAWLVWASEKTVHCVSLLVMMLGGGITHTGVDILGSPLSSKRTGKIVANFLVLPWLMVAAAAAQDCTLAHMVAESVTE